MQAEATSIAISLVNRDDKSAVFNVKLVVFERDKFKLSISVQINHFSFPVMGCLQGLVQLRHL